MPLVYHSALMALGQVVYPCMDKTALDSLAMEKMLVLAQEMGVMLPIVEEEAQISLWVARCSGGESRVKWDMGRKIVREKTSFI
ncbi:unnamed protein product [Lampetra fluviatilis]